ncbi:MAG: tRNA threonylcarbamoyladenosine dehydratase [Bacteroidales bacterium]|nr:tRNA threonylcarbamoyladenosine dehydratase [Bacteroidales bacterium]
MDSFGSEIYGRVRLLLGDDVTSALARTRVIIFGVGGVGSWCAEGLLRSGISDITLVDPDTVSVTNVNRQLMATSRTVGQVKVEALRERLLEIDPQARITALRKVYCEETAGEFDLDSYDYVIDAVDSLKNKTLLILNATAGKARFFCSLGAALKVDPRRIKVAEFWDVRGCPLGAALRKRMKKAGTLPSRPFLCVYDDEVLANRGSLDDCSAENSSFLKAQVNGSLVHITSIFGMTLAGLVVEDIRKSVVK